ATSAAAGSIPANYLALYQKTGQTYGIPWNILAGIGEVESEHGRGPGPGIHSGDNGFGAAGPMQIGIGGAATNNWGGAPRHPTSEHPGGGGGDGDRDGWVDVYAPADAIPGAAVFLLRHGAPTDMHAAILGYNHAEWYVTKVLSWAQRYAAGNFTISGDNTI